MGCTVYHVNWMCTPYFSYIILAWVSYQIRKIADCACAGNAGNVFPRRRFQRKPLVSDPGMHHGTCVTHVPWCMSRSLTCGDGENVPGIPGACAPTILRIWQEAHWHYFLTTDTRPQWNLLFATVNSGRQEINIHWSFQSVNISIVNICACKDDVTMTVLHVCTGYTVLCRQERLEWLKSHYHRLGVYKALNRANNANNTWLTANNGKACIIILWIL